MDVVLQVSLLDSGGAESGMVVAKRVDLPAIPVRGDVVVVKGERCAVDHLEWSVPVQDAPLVVLAPKPGPLRRTAFEDWDVVTG